MSSSSASSWDPLEQVGVGSDAIAGAQRRAITNILKSYTGFFDPFCELIQNALDAIDRRASTAGPAYKPKIRIEIDLESAEFRVIDNGSGFAKDEFKSFLAPHITFKENSLTRGRKGVGATYLAYGFNYLSASTKQDDFVISATMRGGREWIEDKQEAAAKPKVKAESIESPLLSEIDQGSAFVLQFSGANIRPQNLGWYQASTAVQWKALLLAKTPLGHIAIDPEVQSTTEYEISVKDRAGVITKEEGAIGYTYPHQVLPSCRDVNEIAKEVQRRVDAGKDASFTSLPGKFKNLNGVWGEWSTEQLLDLLSDRPQDILDLMSEHKVCAYGYFCYSVKLFDSYNDDIAKLRKGTRVVRGGIQMATKGMPQGDVIPIPLTSNIGYQNQSHVIVHFHDADPDLGRKGFQPELKQVAEQIGVAIVNRLKRYRMILKKDTGAAPDIGTQTEIDTWLDRQKEHERDNPLELIDPRFFLPTARLPITAAPKSEQDVIALFSQLLAGGVIRGIRLLATDQHSTYDGVYRFCFEEPRAIHMHDVEQNPLGVVSDPGFAGQSTPYILEYKYSLDSLWAEFDSEDKNESDIRLVVSYEMGDQWKKRYVVTSYLDPENTHHRPAHGLTHELVDDHSGARRFYAVILKDLIHYLQDPSSCVADQVARYSED